MFSLNNVNNSNSNIMNFNIMNFNIHEYDKYIEERNKMPATVASAMLEMNNMSNNSNYNNINNEIINNNLDLHLYDKNGNLKQIDKNLFNNVNFINNSNIDDLNRNHMIRLFDYINLINNNSGNVVMMNNYLNIIQNNDYFIFKNEIIKLIKNKIKYFDVSNVNQSYEMYLINSSTNGLVLIIHEDCIFRHINIGFNLSNINDFLGMDICEIDLIDF